MIIQIILNHHVVFSQILVKIVHYPQQQRTIKNVHIKNGIQMIISGLYMNRIKVDFVIYVVIIGNRQHHRILK
jgi:hypothetical protein